MFRSSSSTPWLRRKGLVNQAGPDPRHLVGGDRRPNAASTDGHAAIDLSAGDRAGQGHDEIRVVIVRLRLPVAEIDDFMAGGAEHRGEIFLQLVTAVVGGDADALRRCGRVCHWKCVGSHGNHGRKGVYFWSARGGMSRWSPARAPCTHGRRRFPENSGQSRDSNGPFPPACRINRRSRTGALRLSRHGHCMPLGGKGKRTIGAGYSACG